MIRVNGAEDRYATGEEDYLIGTLRTDLKRRPLGFIVAHGSGDDAKATVLKLRNLWPDLGLHGTVHVGDLGWQTWGSDLVVKRISQAVSLLLAQGVQRIALIGMSMGGCSVLNYAYRYPKAVTCVAALIPLTDLQQIRDNPWLAVRWPEIDAIYGAPPNQNYDGHSPITFAADMDKKLPIKIWYSENDPLVYPYTIHNFAAARPETEVVSVGNFGHDIPVARYMEIIEWVVMNSEAN